MMTRIINASHYEDELAEAEMLIDGGRLKKNIFINFKDTAKKVAVVAIPILVTNASTTANNFVGATIASNHGNKSISGAASAIIFPVQISLIVVFSAPLFAVPVAMQKYVDRNDRRLIGSSIMQGMKLSLLLSFIPSVLSYFTGDLFQLLGTPKDVVELINNYFHVFCYVIPSQLLAFSMQQAAIGLGSTRFLVMGSLLNTSFTLGSSYFLSKGYFGLHDLGNVGVAYGFLVGGLLRIIFYGLIFYCSKSFKTYLIYTLDNLKNNMILKDIWKIGWPFSLQLISELGAINALSAIVDQLPKKIYSLDVLNTMNQYNLFSVIIPVGLSESAAVLISKACASNSYMDVRRLGNNVLFLGLIYNLFLVVLGLAIPSQLASLFMNDREVSGRGASENLRKLFLIVFIGLMLNSGRDVVTGALRPLHIVKSPMYASYIALWLFGLPLAYVLGVTLKLRVTGVLLGYYSGTSVGTAFMLGKWIINSRPSAVKAVVENSPSSVPQSRCCSRSGFFMKGGMRGMTSSASDIEAVSLVDPAGP